MSFRRNAAVVLPGKYRRDGSRAQPASGSTLQQPARASTANSTTRPSTITSSYAVHSTGTSDLDSLVLLHGGLPLGTDLLVLEDGATDFASVLIRCYAAQGCVNGDKVIAGGVAPNWHLELPAFARSQAVESTDSKPIEGEEFKIAWRYRNMAQGAKRYSEAENQIYRRDWDFGARMVPPAKVEYATGDFTSIISTVREALKSDAIVRLVLPSFLNPTVYDLSSFEPQKLLRFFHTLRALLRQHRSQLSILITLSTTLFDDNTEMLLPSVIQLVDGALHLRPFTDETDPYKSTTNTQTKVQGLLDVVKIPIISERGIMTTRIGEHAFRVSKRRFVIEDWGIPVTIDEEKKDKEAF